MRVIEEKALEVESFLGKWTILFSVALQPKLVPKPPRN